MPYLGASGDVPGANIKSYRYKQGTDTSTGATSFPAVNKGADELRVYLNGALLKLTDDYTFTTSAVTISPAPADDDEIQIDVYTSMNLADTVSSSDGGNFVGAVTFQAGVKTGAVKAQDGTSAITIADSTGKVTIPGDLEIQGTTTTIDTNVESVDKLEVGANSSDYAVSITQSGAGVGLDINGSELVLDADADTSIHASTDDQIDIKVGGTDKVTIDSTALKTDDIQEKTTDHGVEIEQVTLKDGGGTFTGNVAVNGDLTVDTSTLKVDSLTNRIGITNASPGEALHIKTTADADYGIKVENDDTQAFCKVQSSGNALYGGNAGVNIVSGGSFATAMHIKADGNVGIGITDPASNDGWGKTLEVGGTAGGELSLNHSDASATQGIGQVAFTRDSATLASVNGVTGTDTSSAPGEADSGITKGELNFRTHNGTSNATRMTVESNGNVTVEDGDLVIGTAGHGITFQSAGGTGTSNTANTLDDYETGTFTATCANGVTLKPGLDQCKYTKIGEQVTVRGQVQVNLDQSGAIFQINNLPFTSKAVGAENDNYAIGAVRTYQWELDASDLWVIAEIDAGSSTLSFLTCRDNAAAVSLPADSNAYIMFTISYTAS